MYTCNKDTAEHRVRNGLVSRWLLDSRLLGEKSPLAITWVTVEPGARQYIHNHPEAQVYVIIAGAGLMTVGDETQPVAVGDCIYIPSDAPHGIENTGNEELAYVSAATPAFDIRAAYDGGS